MDSTGKREIIREELLLDRVIIFNIILPKEVPARPQIDIYDEYGTVVASFPPIRLGAKIQTR